MLRDVGPVAAKHGGNPAARRRSGTWPSARGCRETTASGLHGFDPTAPAVRIAAVSEQAQPTSASVAQATLGQNAWSAEEKYQQFLSDPTSVDPSWRCAFLAAVTSPFRAESSRPVAAMLAQPTRFRSATALAAVPTITRRATARSAGNGHAERRWRAWRSPVSRRRRLEIATAPPAFRDRRSRRLPLTGSGGDDRRCRESCAQRRAAEFGCGRPVGSKNGAAPASSEDAPVALRGVAARIAANMVESLTVPTATSVHPLPAKVLEVNRRTINEYLERTSAAKVSYTHLIAYAVVRALGAYPSLNSGFVPDIDGNGTPGVVHHSHVNLGIAIDLERAGGRTLVVPAVRFADTLDFTGFVAAYEDLVRRARDNKLSIDDLTGVTVTITNPGTLGTTQSVPRLMSGQGAIIGVGALELPRRISGDRTRQRSLRSVSRRCSRSPRPMTTASSKVRSRGSS